MGSSASSTQTPQQMSQTTNSAGQPAFSANSDNSPYNAVTNPNPYATGAPGWNGTPGPTQPLPPMSSYSQLQLNGGTLPGSSSQTGGNPNIGATPQTTSSIQGNPVPTSGSTSSNQMQSTNGGVGVNQSSINPGQTEPNASKTNSNPVIGAQPNASAQTSQSFLPAKLTAPLYNNAATAGNLGTQAASLTNGSTNFLNTMFNESGAGGTANNYLNQMQSSTLSPAAQASLGAGTQAATVALDQGMAQQNSEYMDTPFSSTNAIGQGNIIGQYANNLTTQAANLGLQQMQLGTNAAESQQSVANQQAQFPSTFALNASSVPVTDAQNLQNMGNSAYSSGYQVPESTYSQIPYLAPTTLTQAGSGSSKGIL